VKRRAILAALLCLPVLAGAGLALFRHITVTRLEAGLLAWIAERRTEGWTVRVGALRRGAWWAWGGGSVSLVLHDVTLSGAPAPLPGPVSWTAPRVTLSVDVLDPWELTITPDGLQALRLPDGTSVTVIADGLVASLSAGPEVAIDAKGLRVEAISEGDHAALTVENLDFDLTIRPSGDNLVTLEVTAEGLMLPDVARWVLGRRIERISLTATMNGPWPAARDAKAWASAWRDGGGVVEAKLLGMVWGPLDVSGAATLALDDQLQPMGAGTAHLVGFPALFDTLGRTGALTQSAAKATKSLLSLMAGAPSGQQKATVDVPLTLQFRTLSLRQVPLALLPEIEWP
jgi:hypothetical protein